MNIKLEPDCISGNDVLTVEGLSKSFDNLHLFSDISFEIKRGEHVALIGDNGTGKTTILKIINDIISADAGTVKLGTNVHIGYYDQEHHNLEDGGAGVEHKGTAALPQGFGFFGRDLRSPLHSVHCLSAVL